MHVLYIKLQARSLPKIVLKLPIKAFFPLLGCMTPGTLGLVLFHGYLNIVRQCSWVNVYQVRTSIASYHSDALKKFLSICKFKMTAPINMVR